MFYEIHRGVDDKGKTVNACVVGEGDDLLNWFRWVASEIVGEQVSFWLRGG